MTNAVNSLGGGISPPSSRIEFIDALRGFGILCVVLGHVADGFINAGMFSEHNSLFLLHDSIYSFHMALLMLISGYVFYEAYFDEQGFLKVNCLHRQLLNLIIIYIVFDIAFGCFKVICSRFTNIETSVMDVLLFPVRPISPYWYIYLLIPFYVIFSLKIVHRHEKFVLILTVASCLLSSFVHISYFELRRFLFYLFFFWFGVCFRKGKVRIFENKVIIIISVVVAIAFRIFIWNGFMSSGIPGIDMFIGLSISGGLWYLFEHVAAFGENKFLGLCGRYSLEIYLIHCVFTAGARAIFPDFILNHYLVSVVLNFVLSTIIPIAIALICKKLSIHELIFKPANYFCNRRKAK